MSTNFSTALYTLTVASIGASLVATKFFSAEHNNISWAIVSIAAGFVTASVITLINDLRDANAKAKAAEADHQWEEIWRTISDHRRDLETEINTVQSRVHQRMDQEVDAIDRRIDHRMTLRCVERPTKCKA